jgi:uncharacterized protein
MRVILDTNIFVSAFIFDSKLNQELYDRAENGNYTIIMSQELMEEIETKFRKFKLSDIEITKFKIDILELAEWVEVETKIEVCRDPKDNFLLSLAIDGEANILTTRDKDLLELDDEGFSFIEIIKPEDFIQRLRDELLK